MSLSSTERTRLNRHKDRTQTSRQTLYDILDAGLVCHLGVVLDGSPRVIPTGYGRIGDTLYLHGSSGAASLLARDAEVCVTVTHVDGLVLSRSAFNHSMNYRSAMVFATPRRVDDPEEKLAGLRAVTENLAPGRWDAVRPPTRKELAATLVLALSLDEASAKIRQGPPNDDEQDLDADVWAGVVPLVTSFGVPEQDPVQERPHLAPPDWAR